MKILERWCRCADDHDPVRVETGRLVACLREGDGGNRARRPVEVDPLLVVAEDAVVTPVVGETVGTKANKGTVTVKPPDQKSFVELDTV